MNVTTKKNIKLRCEKGITSLLMIPEVLKSDKQTQNSKIGRCINFCIKVQNCHKLRLGLGPYVINFFNLLEFILVAPAHKKFLTVIWSVFLKNTPCTAFGIK